MNNWTLSGRLGKDAETRTTQNGKTVVAFTLATDEMKNGEKSTLWTDVSWWNDKAANLVPYLKKGAVVVVEGRPKASHYTNKNNETVDKCEMIANRVEMMSFVKDEQQQNQPAPTAQAAAQPVGDLPF